MTLSRYVWGDDVHKAKTQAERYAFEIPMLWNIMPVLIYYKLGLHLSPCSGNA